MTSGWKAWRVSRVGGHDEQPKRRKAEGRAWGNALGFWRAAALQAEEEDTEEATAADSWHA